MPAAAAIPPCHLRAGDLEAVFLPELGMLGSSLRHRGEEVLRRIDGLEKAAAKGSTAGIPLLHPWANRLGGLRFPCCGQIAALDPASALLHLDEDGLPIHGVPWARLRWTRDVSSDTRVEAHLDWTTPALLAVFPFPHSLRLSATLTPDWLEIETRLAAGPVYPVPVSFGFHPYFGFTGAPRTQWRLTLPAMRRLVLDAQRLPTGAEEPFGGFDGPLASKAFDDGFALDGDETAFMLVGLTRRITLRLVRGYRFAQVYAPAAQALVALEPMTSPTDALRTGRGLRVAPPGSTYEAAFRIEIGEAR